MERFMVDTFSVEKFMVESEMLGIEKSGVEMSCNPYSQSNICFVHLIFSSFGFWYFGHFNA